MKLTMAQFTLINQARVDLGLPDITWAEANDQVQHLPVDGDHSFLVTWNKISPPPLPTEHDEEEAALAEAEDRYAHAEAVRIEQEQRKREEEANRENQERIAARVEDEKVRDHTEEPAHGE